MAKALAIVDQNNASRLQPVRRHLAPAALA